MQEANKYSIALIAIFITIFSLTVVKYSSPFHNHLKFTSIQNNGISASNKPTRLDRFMTVNCDKDGRLGNKMSQYATLLVNAKYYNVSCSSLMLSVVNV